ncbi:Mus7/MMS22 family-domain-containing protein [Flammula alnicola]|nr:Mus7/MMS22 family-domain-containing protein [Flammula alnicola]
MMDIDDDDIIETSDIEELEELQGKAERSPRARNNCDEGEYVEDDISYPPRKRMKLFHENPDPPNEELGMLSVSPTKSLLADTSSPLRSRSSSTVLNIGSPSQEFTFSRSPTQIPAKLEHAFSEGYSPLSGNSQDPLLLRSPTQRLIPPQGSPIRLPFTVASLADSQQESNTSGSFGNPDLFTDQPTTPRNSSPTAPRRSPSVDLLSLFGTTPSPIPSSHIHPGSPSPADKNFASAKNDDDDELLTFTPAKLNSPRAISSPLTPTSSRSLSQAPTSLNPADSTRELSLTAGSVRHRSARSSPSPVSPQGPEQDEHVADLGHVLEVDAHGSRYSFRKRNVAQLNPYTIEDLKYKRALRSNPDAIVKLKAIERRSHHHHPEDHYEDDGETQQDVYVDDGNDEDASWEEKERRREEQREERRRRRIELETRRASSEQDSTKYPDILRDLSSSDDEEMDALAKEAKKILKRKEKERKTQEKEERQRQREEQGRKAKRFPISKSKNVHPESSSRRPDSPTEMHDYGAEVDDKVQASSIGGFSLGASFPVDQARIIQDYFGEGNGSESETDDTPAHPVVGENRRVARASSSISDRPHNSQEYFGEGDEFEMYDQNNLHPVNDDVLTLDEPPSPSMDVLEGSRETTIRIESDEELSADNSEIVIDLLPSEERCLERTMPKSMIRQLAVKDAAPVTSKKTKRRVRPTASSDNDHEGPLLPGQTRVQKSANPKDVRDIKGDSESEMEIDQDSDSFSADSSRPAGRHVRHNSDSDSDVVEILKSYRQPKHLQVNDLVKEEDGFWSEDTFDDEDIQENFFPDEETRKSRTNGQITRLQDESMIDWMLTRSRTIGGPRREHKLSRSNHRQARSSSSKFKFDVTTRGARGHGHMRQTLLSFDKDGATKKRKHRPESGSATAETGRGRAGPSRRTSAGENHSFLDSDSDSQAEDSDNVQVIEGEKDHGQKKFTWKEKKKARRERARRNGVWCNPSNGQAITTGITRAYVTVDVEDEGFHLALAPGPLTQAQRDHWSKSFRPPPPPKANRKSRLEKRDDHGEEVHDEVKKSPRSDLSSDLNIPLLHAGKSFGDSTYISKGWLYELINVASTAQDPVLPPPTTLLGFSLDPAMGLEGFCLLLPRISDSLFEFATGLPDPDDETLKTQWIALTHYVSQLVSWYLKDGEEKESITLRKAVEKEVSRLVEQVEKHSFTFIDAPVLVLGWFAVEMSARFGRQIQPPSATEIMTRPLKGSSILLINLLLQFGLRKTMDPLQNGSDLDGTMESHYAAELWVCLIHVLSNCSPKDGTSKQKIHPFWSILLEVIHLRTQKDNLMTPFHASEDTWFTVFSLCALSQFSQHGMTVGQPRLPACWDSVVFALKRIRLTVNNTDTDDSVARQRDKYVAMVTVRCMHLRERWQWKLDGASAMFNALADIFRSRKFANLLHEVDNSDFPEFFRLANWDLLKSYDPKDTAYTVFLKLIVQAAREDASYNEQKPSPKVKKLLSLAVPLGSLSFSKATSSNKHDLSMFYNRLSAVAIAVDLDISEYDDRTLKARNYIPFANADVTMRCAVIRGVTRWSILMIARGVKLKAMLDWIEEITKVVEMELKKYSSSEPASSQTSNATDPARVKEKGRLVLFTNILLGSVRQIIESYVKFARYPEPALLAVLKPVLTSWILREDAVKIEFGRLAKAIFKARAIALPPPPRPPLQAPTIDDESQESQDFGMDDFNGLDWSNIDLPEALVATPNPTTALGPSTNTSNDDALRHALETTRFRWIIRPFLSPCLQPPPDGVPRKLHEGECDMWVRLWLCCGSLEPQEDKWSTCLRLLDKMLEGTTDEHWTRRVQLSIMYQVLKLDPMAYMNMTDRAIEVFLFALVSDSVILEKEYVALLLSIAGLRHPLLHGATCLPGRNEASGDFEFSSEQFLELRLPLLQVIFRNLNTSLRMELGGNLDVALDNEKYISFSITMFSKMRNSLAVLQGTQKRESYQEFCHHVFAAFQENAELSMHKRFEFWTGTWGPGLTNHA